MSVILGINAYHAGSSACIVVDGVPIFAVAEERLNRKKYYGGFPKMSIEACLEYTGLKLNEIDYVAIGRDSKSNIQQKLKYTLKNPSKLLNLAKIKSARSSLSDIKTMIGKEFSIESNKLKFQQINVEHHLAHIASAFFISDWDNSTGFSCDGSGDFVTSMVADCYDNKIDVKERIFVPNSLGSFYSMISEFIGYAKYGDEGKVMGLSALGDDTYVKQVEEMLVLNSKGIILNPDYFLPFGSNQGVKINENGSMEMTRHYSELMVNTFGKPREKDSAIKKRDKDLAFAVQVVFEKAYLHLLNLAHKHAPNDKIAMAGGCVLNSVANGMIFDKTPFDSTVIQPAAGDDGLSMGAALYTSNILLKEKNRFVMENSYFGPDYSNSIIKSELNRHGVSYKKLGRHDLLDYTSDEIVNGKVIGWFQGRMEWGPRALGNRSIICHPGLTNMKDILNARIKHRESFRPFAPAILVEYQNEVFEIDYPSPFMLHVYKIKPSWQKRLPAVNHLDNTGRLQTVSRFENKLYYDLISTFNKKTGIPIVLNTSFNENEPIVCNPSEAIDCFKRTKMDILVIGSYFCKKEIS